VKYKLKNTSKDGKYSIILIVDGKETSIETSLTHKSDIKMLIGDIEDFIDGNKENIINIVLRNKTDKGIEIVIHSNIIKPCVFYYESYASDED
jgi:hypothetical protein